MAELRFIWFILFVWFIWFVLFRERDKPDELANPPWHMDHLPAISHPRDPLHGITLETIVTQLVERHGWVELGRRLPVRCFLHNPSIKSSLTFLRKTPWARAKVEQMFITEFTE